MAQKRMFSLAVVDTDRFMDMPTSTQALYFHLGMHGDDDGFVSSPRKIARSVGCCDDDVRILAAKGFIIPFDSGVVVLTDWKVNNTLKSDRYKPTIYLEERSLLTTGSNGKYEISSILEPTCFQNSSTSEPQYSIEESSKYNVVSKAGNPPVSSNKICDSAVQLLNDLSGSRFRATTNATQKLIQAREKEGYTLEDIEAVIRHQCKQWGQDAKMQKYLRPETLFGNKFEGYLSDARRQEPKQETEYTLAPVEDPWEMAVKEGQHV